MITPLACVTAAWAVLIVVWFVGFFNNKAYVRRGSWGLGIRLIGILIVIALAQLQPVREFLVNERFTQLPYVAWPGVIICICGVAFAIWARVSLGRNWGMPTSLKQNAELVTSGPYAYVRHPIYTGFIFAALGSTLVVIWWVIPFAFMTVYFIWAATKEEKIMLGEFGEKYADYMKRSKMLIPFIF